VRLAPIFSQILDPVVVIGSTASQAAMEHDVRPLGTLQWKILVHQGDTIPVAVENLGMRAGNPAYELRMDGKLAVLDPLKIFLSLRQRQPGPTGHTRFIHPGKKAARAWEEMRVGTSH